MLNKPEDAFQPGDALVIVDVQNDFCSGGALAIQDGGDVVPVLNHWIAAAVAMRVPIYASLDWHPVDHISFEQQGGPWPPHCIQDSEGAQFHPQLQLPDSVIKITKGVRFDQDQNSVFDQTGLTYQLRLTGIKRLWIGGLAEDVCVLATVLDARRDNFDVVLIENATKPVSATSGERARRQMREAGAQFESTG
ncbi:MAG: isochorismatase family protein [Deltaproteobacteria bacterium]|nr:isochorismatase family protein [Deltaproteobacteria bacterium]MBV8451123.1 isochorismatase family protein [Deltaproteobacteria bacterium]